MKNNKTEETRLEKLASAAAAISFWATTFSAGACLYLDKPDLVIPTLIGGGTLSCAAALVEAGETTRRVAPNMHPNEEYYAFFIEY